MEGVATETRTIEELPRAAVAESGDLLLIQAPGGPAQGITLGMLLEGVTSADVAVLALAELTTNAAAMALPVDSLGLVFSDADPAMNGYWKKTSAEGAGTWEATGLPNGKIVTLVQSLIDEAAVAAAASAAAAATDGAEQVTLATAQAANAAASANDAAARKAEVDVKAAEIAVSLITKGQDNLFSSVTAEAKTLNAATGVTTASAAFMTSPFIRVIAPTGSIYSRTFNRQLAWYAANNEASFISGQVAGYTAIKPANANYVKITFSNAEIAGGNAALVQAMLAPVTPYVPRRVTTDLLLTKAQAKEVLTLNELLNATDQIRKLRTAAITQESPNLFNPDFVYPGYKVSGLGMIPTAGWFVTVIPVKPNTIYYFNQSQTIIEANAGGQTSVSAVQDNYAFGLYRLTTSATAAFLITSGASPAGLTTLLVTEGPPPGTNYPFNRYYLSAGVAPSRPKLEGKNGLFGGDSIIDSQTDWVNQPEFLQACGIRNYPLDDLTRGWAVGGRTIAERPNAAGVDARGVATNQNSLVQTYASEALIPVGAQNVPNEGVARKFDTGRDFVLVSCMTNDFGSPDVAGGFGAMASRDTLSFYGALHLLIGGDGTATYPGLIYLYPLKPVLFTTAPPRQTWRVPNAFGKTLRDYGNAMLEVCAYYSVPCLDLMKESMLRPNVPANFAVNYNDVIHPGAVGSKPIAVQVAEWINRLAI